MKTENEEALAVRESQAIASRPSFLPQSGPARGAEGIDSDEVRPPKLILCQKGSPQKDRESAKYIANLEEGDMFQSQTRTNFGRGPVNFTPVKRLGRRWMEFDKDGNVVDPDVRPGDPRTKFTNDVNNPRVRVKPVATEFRDYLILLTDEPISLEKSLVVVSFAGSRLRAAGELATAMQVAKFAGDDSFSRQFSLSSVMERKDKISWANFKLVEHREANGDPTYVSEAAYRAAERAYLMTETKTVVVEREVGEADEPGSHDGDDAVVDAEVVRDSKIPF